VAKSKPMRSRGAPPAVNLSPLGDDQSE